MRTFAVADTTILLGIEAPVEMSRLEGFSPQWIHIVSLPLPLEVFVRIYCRFETVEVAAKCRYLNSSGSPNSHGNAAYLGVYDAFIASDSQWFNYATLFAQLVLVFLDGFFLCASHGCTLPRRTSSTVLVWA